MIYKPKGVCSQSIEINMNGNVIDSVAFTGGCNGNLQGISSLVKGMTAEELGVYLSYYMDEECIIKFPFES